MSGRSFLTLSLVLSLASQNLVGQTTYHKPDQDPQPPSGKGQKTKPKKPTFEDFVLGKAVTPGGDGNPPPDSGADPARDPGSDPDQNPESGDRPQAPQTPPRNPSQNQQPDTQNGPLPSRAPTYAGTREAPLPVVYPNPAPLAAPATPTSKIQYSPLIIEAAIHRVVSFPIPFMSGRIILPGDGTKVEVANAIVSAQQPSPINLILEFSKPGHPTVAKTTSGPLGWLPISPPDGYEGCSVLIQSAIPLIAWRINLLEQALFGLDRQHYFRRFIAPIGSQWRVEVQSLDSIPWDSLPANPKAIAEHPVLGKPWQAFLDAARQAK